MKAHEGLVHRHNDRQFGKASPGKIGMWLFLGADGMSFAGLLLAYGVLRATRDWPNPVEALGGVGLSGFMTFWLICSSVSMVLAIDACKALQRQKMLFWLMATVVGGGGFLLMQVYEYAHLINDLGMRLFRPTPGGRTCSRRRFSRSPVSTVCTFCRGRCIWPISTNWPTRGVSTRGTTTSSNWAGSFGTLWIWFGFWSSPSSIFYLKALGFWLFADFARACPGCAGSLNSNDHVVVILTAFILLTGVPFFVIYRVIYKNRRGNLDRS